MLTSAREMRGDGMSDTQRDIAAVMFTDMRGFTALMQSDEELTLQLLELKRRLAKPLLEKHRGRLIKTIGDAFMVEFRSAVDAVRCAVALQQALHDHNATVPAGRQLHIRIGIHMGDVLRSGDDLLGDTVNIAARVEPHADADGVSMTQAVYEQVRNRIEYRIEAQGIVELKGVAGETALYRVLLP
jgi:adenylate cyclase